MHAFPFQIQPCSVSEKSCSKKISPTSQHKLPDSEILSFFLSHKTQHPSVSFPSNHHWSIPCRYLCACKTRVRKRAQAPGEGRLLVVIHSHKSQTGLFDQAATCLEPWLLCWPVCWYWICVCAGEGQAGMSDGKEGPGSQASPWARCWQHAGKPSLALPPVGSCQLLGSLPPGVKHGQFVQEQWRQSFKKKLGGILMRFSQVFLKISSWE